MKSIQERIKAYLAEYGNTMLDTILSELAARVEALEQSFSLVNLEERNRITMIAMADSFIRSHPNLLTAECMADFAREKMAEGRRHDREEIGKLHSQAEQLRHQLADAKK